MIRHWTRHLKTETDPAERRHMIRSRMINTFGLCMTAVVFVVILLTKFLAGAWIAILAMCVFFMLMKAIRRHYDNVTRELAADDEDKVLPTKVHAIVLVSKLHKPTLRALAYAKATRAQRPRGGLRRLRRQVDQGPGPRVGRAQPRRTPQGPLLAVPRDRAADRRLRHPDPEGQPARGGRGLHPGVRRRPLVGAAAPQPDRAAAQGPAAVHARA